MTDIVDPMTRSRMMSGIRGKNTKPELIVRSLLHKQGFRFRLHKKDLPGTPDLVLPKYRAVIFIHGCFWHGHDCSFFKLPASRSDFWQKKIQGNRLRDFRCLQELQNMGWRSLVIWECAIRGKSPSSMKGLVECIGNWLNKGADSMSIDARGSHV